MGKNRYEYRVVNGAGKNADDNEIIWTSLREAQLDKAAFERWEPDFGPYRIQRRCLVKWEDC